MPNQPWQVAKSGPHPNIMAQKQTQASINKLKDEYRKQASKLLYSETTSRNTIYTSLIQTLVENEINRASSNLSPASPGPAPSR